MRTTRPSSGKSIMNRIYLVLATLAGLTAAKRVCTQPGSISWGVCRPQYASKLTEKVEVDVKTDSISVSAYYINLKRRPDRRREIEGELKNLTMPLERIEAVDIANNDTILKKCWDQSDVKVCAGQIGCQLSHIKALNLGDASGADAVAIFEDDFAWLLGIEPSRIISAVKIVAKKLPSWNVIGISLNILNQSHVEPGVKLQMRADEHTNVVRVNEAQTTHGYIVKSTYIPVLRDNFERCPVHESYEVAIDTCWKSLQLKDSWYGFSPQLGTQRPSFSDIENMNVNHGIAS
jgi:GR25 family glycosyltransferase involved in LPS biosynthesis